jgi:hypothetical protein
MTTDGEPTPVAPAAGGPDSTGGPELTDSERAELERLRARSSGRAARGWRWVATCALLLIASLLGVVSVVAVYLRSEVLDTNAYVQTVAPLARDPAVQDAVAARLTTEIVTRSNLNNLVEEAATKLVAAGAPSQVSDLVGPVTSGMSNFLQDQIRNLLGTEQFAEVWTNINRAAHQGVVNVLTGKQGGVISSQGDTVTIDLGQLLTAAKQQLAAKGLTFVNRIPDVSIPYTLVQSDKLPQIRTYTKLLNTLATWLPFVVLALLVGAFFTAPNRRRAIVIGSIMLGCVILLMLGGLNAFRDYYLNHLPPTVNSPQAVQVVYDTVLRFLVASLKTLLLVMVIFLVAALLAGPSRLATAIRRLANRGLDPLSGLLARAGGWVGSIGRALRPLRSTIQLAVVLLALVGFILADRPSTSGVVWLAVVVGVVLLAVELFVRAAASPTVAHPPPPATPLPA